MVFWNLKQLSKKQRNFKKYPVDYCCLFGSYAGGKATERSDVDLFIFTELTGLKYFGLIEELRENLRKRVDLVTF